MKICIVAGGFGTRLQDESSLRPKPMVTIGGYPILWHIMKIYAAHGFKEFVIALGYKGEVIKSYFLNYCRLQSNLSVNLKDGQVVLHNHAQEDWLVHLVDTGLHTQTGGRIKRLAPWLGAETFMMTYGDGVSNIDLGLLLAFHRNHKKAATITAVRPPARFGSLDMKDELVSRFAEKRQTDQGWINGGFFVLEPEVLDYIAGDETIFERAPLETLVSEGQLVAYRHTEFWQCMDTPRDVRLLESMWEGGRAPWKVWE